MYELFLYFGRATSTDRITSIIDDMHAKIACE